MGYNGASIVAGLLPFIATALFGWFSWLGPALVFMLLGVISTAVAVGAPETAPAVLALKSTKEGVLLPQPPVPFTTG